MSDSPSRAGKKRKPVEQSRFGALLFDVGPVPTYVSSGGVKAYYSIFLAVRDGKWIEPAVARSLLLDRVVLQCGKVSDKLSSYADDKILPLLPQLRIKKEDGYFYYSVGNCPPLRCPSGSEAIGLPEVGISKSLSTEYLDKQSALKCVMSLLTNKDLTDAECESLKNGNMVLFSKFIDAFKNLQRCFASLCNPCIADRSPDFDAVGATYSKRLAALSEEITTARKRVDSLMRDYSLLQAERGSALSKLDSSGKYHPSDVSHRRLSLNVPHKT